MAFLNGLMAFVLTDSTIVSLIADRLGPGPSTDQPPVYPYTDWFLISGNNEYIFVPEGQPKLVYRNARVQFDHVGLIDDAAAVGAAFEDLLEEYQGPLPDGSRVSFVESAGGLTGPTLVDPTIHKFSQDFLFQYVDPV